MSQDQAPEKVKLYSGGSTGGRPGVRAVSGGGAAAQRRRGDEPDGRQSAAALPPVEEGASGINWLTLILFVLGCAIGGALFTLLMSS